MTSERAATALVCGVDDVISRACQQHLHDAGFESAEAGDRSALGALVINPGLYDLNSAAHATFETVLASIGRHEMRLVAGSGAVVIITSRDWLGSAGRGWAAATAAAVVASARSAALRLAPSGVTVNTVVVLSRNTDPGDAAEPRPLTPEPILDSDVGSAVAFFAAPQSRYITGQTLFVDGGSHLLSSLSV